MPSWMSWVLDELAHIRKFPRMAVGLVILAALGAWYTANFLSRTQISNLQSEVALLKSELTAADGPSGPLSLQRRDRRMLPAAVNVRPVHSGRGSIALGFRLRP